MYACVSTYDIHTHILNYCNGSNTEVEALSGYPRGLTGRRRGAIHQHLIFRVLMISKSWGSCSSFLVMTYFLLRDYTILLKKELQVGISWYIVGIRANSVYSMLSQVFMHAVALSLGGMEHARNCNSGFRDRLPPISRARTATR